MRLCTAALAVVLASVSLSVPARADVTMEMKHDGKAQTMYVTEHKICVPMDEGTMIFRGDLKALWIVDTTEKTYREMTEEEMKKLAEKMNEAMAKMQEAMKNLPPEQRAMAEKMMAGTMPAGTMQQKPERTVKPLGKNAEVNGFQTNGYEVYANQELDSEVWAADPKALGLDQKDFKAFEELADFMKTAVPGMEQMMDGLFKNYEKPDEGDVPGFPVLTIEKNPDGTEAHRSELTKIDKGRIPPGRFEVPEGYKKEKMEFGM